jgi:cell division protein FtsB
MTDTLERTEHDGTPARRARKKRSKWRFMLFITLMGALVLVASGVLPVQQYLERENQVNEALDTLSVLEARNSELADDVAALGSDQEIERVAREQYGFVREGEIGYSVLVQPDSVADPQVPEPVEATEEPGFFGKIWRFITGGDVVDNG